jgi:hypothetical protein
MERNWEDESHRTAEKANSNTLIAMVALNSPRLPEPSRILATLQERCPDCPVPGDMTQKEGTLIFHLDDLMAAATLIPAPIPWSDLEGPCATAWWWPEATEQMSAHKDHVIVALMGASGSPVERHILLTQLVAAIAANADAAGIYWGAGTVVHEPIAFQEQSAELSPDNLAPHLWVDMRLEQNEDGSLRYFTTGMESFGCLEIEIDRSRRQPQEILDFCYGIVSYVLTSGATIRDGETIGRSAKEKIKVYHKPSMWGRGTAMKLEFT